jgi:hypothetical protein
MCTVQYECDYKCMKLKKKLQSKRKTINVEYQLKKGRAMFYTSKDIFVFCKSTAVLP